MKDVIRCGVFETNSSSEHSIILMKNEDYRAWIDKRAMARLCGQKDGTHTTGNFWSKMINLEFTYDIDSANEENYIIALKHAKAEMEGLNMYRDKMLNDPPNMVEWTDNDQNWYECRMNYYNDIINHGCNVIDDYDKLENGLWITYDEFWKAYTEESDCYSPFEHNDERLGMHVIGKYFHT